MKPNFSYINTIYEDSPVRWLNDPEQRQQKLRKTIINTNAASKQRKPPTDDFPAPVRPQTPIFSQGLYDAK
jgi:hypothetical protein